MYARILFLIALLFPVVALAQDAGIAAGSAAVDPAPTVTMHAPDDLARDAYRAIANHDWFLLAGAALSLLVLGARWLLAKKWPRFESELWGMALVAAMAGLGALGNAWIADERLVSTTTLLGAVKVWAVAVWAYVTSKKMLASVAKTKAA